MKAWKRKNEKKMQKHPVGGRHGSKIVGGGDSKKTWTCGEDSSGQKDSTGCCAVMSEKPYRGIREMGNYWGKINQRGKSNNLLLKGEMKAKKLIQLLVPGSMCNSGHKNGGNEKRKDKSNTKFAKLTRR